MKPDYIDIGSTPIDEECTDFQRFPNLARKESAIFARQLERQFGCPDGCHLAVKMNPHDFGNYPSVVALFSSEEGLKWALEIEHNTPENWDKEARIELEKAGIPYGRNFEVS